jgi:mono/diheme cytochrome c family protein
MAEAMGTLGMAPPTFHEEEMADLFAYLFLSRYEGRPGDVARGVAVYETKGCASCHGPRGEGNVGPALRAAAGQSKELIVQQMWNHAPAMGEKMSAYGVPWPRFEADDLANLITFLARGSQPADAAADSPRPARPRPPEPSPEKRSGNP